MDVVVTGRHCEVSERFREHVEDKLSRLEKYDHRIIRVDVLVSQELKPRVSDQAVRVEITIKSKGPVLRAEAAGDDKMSALDKAVSRLSAQERKAADRRRIHKGAPSATISEVLVAPPEASSPATGAGSAAESLESTGTVLVDDGPLVVREKTHPAEPMSLDQALYEMELVGHDFFLFVDASTAQPSVVYRRKGYDYGVIRLSA